MKYIKNLFSAFRNYYLHIYYYIAEAKKKALIQLKKDGAAKESKVDSFLYISFVIIPFELLAFFTLILSEQTFYYFFNIFNSYVFFNHIQGPFTGAVLLMLFMGGVLGYLLCCYNIQYESIPKRLKKGFLNRFHFLFVALFPLALIWALVFFKIGVTGWWGI